jgi:hypothetical protein
MTDIYRQGLAIPEKRRVFGWLMLVGGGLMLVIALFLYHQEIHQVRKYEARPWEEPAEKAQVNAETPADVQANLKKTQPLIWITIVIVVLFMAFILGATINHRLAMRLRKSDGRKGHRTVLGDPWKEAGERLQIDEIDGENQE